LHAQLLFDGYLCKSVSIFVKMEKNEYRAVIKFLRLKGNTPTEIKAELDAVYGDSVPSFATVKRWAADGSIGREGNDDCFLG